MQEKNVAHKQLLHISDIENVTGFQRGTLRRMWLKGEFPSPIKLPSGTLVWHVETINQWVEDLKKQ